MAAYAFGWCDVDGDPCGGDGGKGLRPALAVLSAEAVGADGEHAVAGAVTVELVHAFSIVHDDIMDGDERRRDRLTVWKAYGLGPAVLAGDALLAQAIDTLGRASGGPAATRLISGTLVDVVRGQADDLAFESRPWTGAHAVTLQEYTSMAARKTGALTGCASALGAVLGAAPGPLIGAMGEMGRQLGLALQAVDDLLGIWGDPSVTGKPVHSDVRRQKKTLPLIAALLADTTAARELAALLEAPQPPDPHLVAALAEEAGGRSFARNAARRHLDRARATLRDPRLDPVAADELRDLTDFLAERTR
ncbi:polyprenyl synthetase family protein [Nonomuraea sp. NN258]|nr:polyprenyl synthetase family protein [Nonomuraea antri]